MSNDKVDLFESYGLNLHDMKLLKEFVELTRDEGMHNEKTLGQIKQKATDRALEKSTASIFDELSKVSNVSQIPTVHRAIQALLDDFNQGFRKTLEPVVAKYKGKIDGIRSTLDAIKSFGSIVIDPKAFDVKESVTDEDLLGERAKWVLESMLDLSAFDSDSLRSTEEIVFQAQSNLANPNSLKTVMSELKRRDFVMSKTGRSGGFWLTEKGRTRAEKLRKM